MEQNDSNTLLWGGKPWRDGARIPEKQTKSAAAYDVYAWMPYGDGIEVPLTTERIQQEILPGERAIIKTGVNLRIPEGYCVDVKSRSGLAAKFGICVLNGDGLVDDDYIGNGQSYELGVILLNTDKNNTFTVKHLDRIAQIELRPKVSELLGDDGDMDYDEIKKSRGTNRTGGFGSTGVN